MSPDPVRQRVLFAVLSAALVLPGCRTDGDPTIIRADSAGVAIVTNLTAPRVVAATIDTVVVFGGEPEGPGGFYRVGRTLIDVDERGLIYVLDPERYRVDAFLPSGAFVRSWGREGEGPGELRHPLSVVVSKRGEVTVHDPGRGVFGFD